ncbi:hypothetical protein AVEN_269819-1 [Araneus ventricosus]|uniref:Secreted protein n=1 Tax=Araneus ventricosus TaxID=182803 RepID=A0A4Y2PBY0_ARAVE|nr:hypothetical protein AVEN_30847-1 [Araneus ventricosus]GBN28521.1 hypothetical protein AVEN_199194-1 [Araneus ventricosus]GBN48459.1 hypothetical protein AVEN_27038-1 [Araneus ventricosus]GBN48483.1 hypothetical protein AVEN_269819-1 [Araneus ventricosus]
MKMSVTLQEAKLFLFSLLLLHKVDIPVFPRALPQLNRTASDVPTCKTKCNMNGNELHKDGLRPVDKPIAHGRIFRQRARVLLFQLKALTKRR